MPRRTRDTGPKSSKIAKHAKRASNGAPVKVRARKIGTAATKSASQKNEKSRQESFPVVAIGASAGGLEAYSELFRALPADSGMAFVLLQHLDPRHKSMLAEIIARTTRIPVEEIEPGAKIRPDHVYVIPPDSLIAISDGAFRLTPRQKGPSQDLAINHFMRSLAENYGNRAIGVVLSGTASDGTLGLEDIKSEGGITFAQDPASAKYDGMPRSAIDSGCVDFVLQPSGIAQELLRIIQHPFIALVAASSKIESSPLPEDDFNKILALLRRSSGVDFSQYKPSTIHRRVLRRMVILKLDSLGEYAKRLERDSEEAKKLYEDILIPVTSFFRDMDAFDALKSQVFPAIVKSKGGKGVIRIWAPGCSTGEEAYSLAMTLLEVLGDYAVSFQVQIFGTDLNEKGIQRARAGIYRKSIAEEISPERLHRFFVKTDDGYRVTKTVRDMCVFARQNLANDPPFSQMDLVACRNLLIYIQPSLQKKLLPVLYYALNPSGFLMLGSSESVSAFPELFSVVDKKYKIYARRATTSRLRYDFPKTYSIPGQAGEHLHTPTALKATPERREQDIQAEADRLVLKDYAPAGVIVNPALEVVQFRGRTTPYLEQAPGKPSLNLLKLARNGLALELHALIGAARKEGKPVRKEGISLDDKGQKRILNLSVSPLGDRASEEQCFYLVLFSDVTPVASSASGPSQRDSRKSGADGKRQVEQLKQELDSAKETLRSVIEEDDALKEEFQSANEEILSANEELQSTNEELETSKEELQSANEELNTLNDELRMRNNELGELTNDLANLLDAIQIPIVFVGSDLRIRRLTSAAADIFRVLPTDVGRPITDIKHDLDVSDLDQLIKQTLATLVPTERDVQDVRGRWLSLQIRPYRTAEHRIDGAVVLLPDVDRLKQSEQYLKQIIDNVPTPLLVLDSSLRVLEANLTFCKIFHVSQAETARQLLYHLGNGQWNIPRLRELLEEVLPQRRIVRGYSVTHDFERIGSKTMLVSGRRIENAAGAGPATILLAIEDITEQKLAEVAMIRSEKLAVAGRLAAGLAHEINNPLQAVENLLTLIGRSERLNEQDQVFVNMAAQELNRVSDLTRQSLSFFRESTAPKMVKVDDLLDEVLALHGKEIKAKNFTVVTQYRSHEPINTYPGEVRQIVTTLLLNALEACEKDCRITLRVRDSVHRKEVSVRGTRISVADSGMGIPAENRLRIFEPFFTTKGEHGTGLGLWVAQMVVARLGGSIRLRSSVHPGKSGTCFSIFLPHQLPSAPSPN